MLTDSHNEIVLPLRKFVKESLLNNKSVHHNSLYITYLKEDDKISVSEHKSVWVYDLKDIDNAVKYFLWKYEERNK